MNIEEIREGIRAIELAWYGEPPDGYIASQHRTFVDDLMQYLHSKGCVLKVDVDLGGYPSQLVKVEPLI